MSPLETFILQTRQRNVWLKHGSFSIYIRHSTRLIDGKCSNCIDIANIINYKEATRGQGAFWLLIATIKGIAAQTDADYIWIEQVLNERLAASLRVKNCGEVWVAGTPSFSIKLR